MKCLSKKNTYLVFGIGTTGKATIYFLQKNNYNFYVSDDSEEKLKNLTVNNKIINETQKIYKLDEEDLKEKNINFIVLSPSVHAQNNPHEIVNIANKLGITIIPDIDLFYEYVLQYNRLHKTHKKLIAITGTNGKSTTTALTEFLFNQFGKKAVACGNIGVNTLSLDVKQYDLFITEMSSYNLFLLKNTLFETSVLLNITNDHLDYHGSIENYIDAKFKAIKQAKIKILCIDDKNISNFLKKNYQLHPKNLKLKNNDYINNDNVNNIVYISTKQILDNGWSWKKNTFFYNKEPIFSGTFDNLPGMHNIENILSSVVCVTKTLNINDLRIIHDIFEKVHLFQGLPHRLQFVKKINEIYFINDSKATNANSTQKALKTLKNNDIYLIAGGRRKTDGFLSITNDLKHVKHVYLIGEASESFSQELNSIGIKYTKCFNMTNAVLTATKEARKNIYLNKRKHKTIVLLSPLCASWDQYKDFEERGNDFIKIVNSII